MRNRPFSLCDVDGKKMPFKHKTRIMMYIVIKIPVHKNLDYKKLKYQIDHNVQGSKNSLIFHYSHQLTNGPDVRQDDHDS